jgi:hypothetical protein
MVQSTNDSSNDCDCSFDELIEIFDAEQSDESTVDFGMSFDTGNESLYSLSVMQSSSEDDDNTVLDGPEIISLYSVAPYSSHLSGSETTCNNVASVKVKATLLRNMSGNEKEIKKLFLNWKMKHIRRETRDFWESQSKENQQKSYFRTDFEAGDGIASVEVLPSKAKKAFKLKASDLQLSEDKKKEIEDLFWKWKGQVKDPSTPSAAVKRLTNDRRWVDDESTTTGGLPKPVTRKRSSSLEQFGKWHDSNKEADLARRPGTRRSFSIKLDDSSETKQMPQEPLEDWPDLPQLLPKHFTSIDRDSASMPWYNKTKVLNALKSHERKKYLSSVSLKSQMKVLESNDSQDNIVRVDSDPGDCLLSLDELFASIEEATSYRR